ncbi:WD repeat-containing protein 19, partial [Cladochytrium tenue]
PAVSMEWSPDGQTLAVVCDGTSSIFMWDAATRRSAPAVDTNMKGLSLLCWNEDSELIAVGTAKGNLLLYNKTTTKKIPILGKHSKAITCAAWGPGSILACGSSDCSVCAGIHLLSRLLILLKFTLTNTDGDTIFQMTLKGEPAQMKWSNMATDTNATPSPALSMVLGKKTLFFHSLAAPKAPIELAFQQKYGEIVTYSWFGEGYVALGFASGYFVVVSTSKLAVCGDASVRVLELDDFKDMYAMVNLEDDRGNLVRVEWTEDGGFLSVASRRPENPAIQVSFPDKEVAAQYKHGFEIACVAVTVDFLAYGTALGIVHIYTIDGWNLVSEYEHKTPSGKLTTVRLTTHEPMNAKAILKEPEMAQELWAMVDKITARKAWMMVAETSLHALDIKTAKRIYRQVLHDTGAVMTLTALEGSDDMISFDNMDEAGGGPSAAAPVGSGRGAACEDRLALAGHICVIFGDFDQAQELFLRSTDPLAALELRRDLMQWDQALRLAERLAPDQVTFVARECATRLEVERRYAEALDMYGRALETLSAASWAGGGAGAGVGGSTGERSLAGLCRWPGRRAAEIEEHQVLCSAGVARMTFRMGDVTRGMKMIGNADDPKLLADCGVILENIKMFNEAGGLYERAGAWEKAADVYIKGKMWNKIGPLLDKITSPRIFQQYAVAKEATKEYKEAATAYERGKDYENLVRLYVDHLQDIDAAVSVVRETRSKESARIVSRFFQGMRDFRSVVEFLVMAGMTDEAFEVAQVKDMKQHGVMDHFAGLVQNEATPELLGLIAEHFESCGEMFQAGQFYLRTKSYPKALAMFTSCRPADSKAIEMAIETVGLARSDTLTHELIDFLMGDQDGVPKDAKYIFKLYMSLGSFKDAARTAIIIAREEQSLGNYRAAHGLLLDNYRQLKRNKAKVPADLERMLMLLHSYILVKTLIRTNEHEQGARMLIRVARSISRFPAHVVPILTSTVIECQRANFKKEANEYAAVLMRPEYRGQIDPKFKRKIEQLVRRPDRDDVTVDEPLTECPFCGNMLPESVMDCGECRNHIPFCIATGRHMVLAEWSTCPRCEFPALLGPFRRLIEKTGACPMCGDAVRVDEVRPAPNAKELLRGVVDGRETATAAAAGAAGGESDRADATAAAASARLDVATAVPSGGGKGVLQAGTVFGAAAAAAVESTPGEKGVVLKAAAMAAGADAVRAGASIA